MPPITHNRHHILARNENGSEHPDNIRKMKVGDHRNLHNFFGNSYPHEQINKILNIAETALVPDFVDSISKLLDDWRGEFYKKHCMRNGILVPRHYG